MTAGLVGPQKNSTTAYRIFTRDPPVLLTEQAEAWHVTYYSVPKGTVAPFYQWESNNVTAVRRRSSLPAPAQIQSDEEGNPPTRGTLSNSWSQFARLATKMCASGLTETAVSRLPAGTTTSLPFICTIGSADPQVPQKLRL